MYFLILFCFAGVYGIDFTLPGVCPNVTLQKNFDYDRFSGIWHHVAGYASDGEHIHDCATLDLQKVDHGYTLRETYVVLEERKRTQKWYQAKVGTTSDPEYYTQFMIQREIEDLDKVLEYPFMILSTDYDGYAIAYICIWLKEKERKHFGIWHHVAGYASDGDHIHDCATLDLQKVDHGYTLRETYVVLEDRKRTQKWSQAKVGNTSDPEHYTQFVIQEMEGLDSVLEYPFMILSTDYDGYAIAYICIWLKEKERKHFVFVWILTRSKEKLHGETLKQIVEELSKYPELAEHRQEFIFKEFDSATCAFEHKVETDFFNCYFC